MNLGKYIFIGCALIWAMNLTAQPSWQTDPADLDLTCAIGVDHTAAIDAWLLSNGGGTVSAGCGNPVITNDYAGLSPDCAGADSVLVSFTVTDACNDSDMATAWIAINDLTPPTFDQTVADVTVDCDGNTPDLPAISLTDLCDPNPSIEIALVNTQTNNGSCTDHTYTIERQWIALDACGNRDTLRQTIFFVDNEAPTFQGPADLTLSCEDNTDPSSTGEPFNLQDNCSTTNTFELEEFTFFQGCENTFTITRLWRAVDICGNISAPFEQTIVVRDFDAPIFTSAAQDEIFDCSNPTEAENAFQNWVANVGGAVAVDNCSAEGNLTWFAAVPGSYDLNNQATWPGISPGSLAPGNCATSVNGIIRSEQVDFVVYDECNRVSNTSATFYVVDQTAPIFSYCPPDLTLEVLDNTCQLDWTMLLPDVDETCDNTIASYGDLTTSLVTTNLPGELAIVNPVTLTLSNIPTPPASANEDVNILINLANIDGEAPTEFFNIYLSDGTLVGKTNPTDSQCGDSQTEFSLTPSEFQLLSLDGNFTVDLIPNVPTNLPASFGINGGICTVSNLASMVIIFDYNVPTNLELTYSFDGGQPLPLDFNNPPDFTLDLGNHSVVFSATDCAGNTSSCQYGITARDGLAPSITCPANIEYSLLESDDCTIGPEITLPLPPFTSGDCSFLPYSQQQPVNANDALITFEYDPDYLEYVAQEKMFSFTNVQADAVGPAVKFTIEVNGDNQNVDDYFLIYGDDGEVIGATQIDLAYVTFTPGNCPGLAPKATAVLYIDRAIYNSWAQDGVVNITAVPNRNTNIPPPGVDGDGVNPICTTIPNGTPDGFNDGLSSIYVTLETETAQLVYNVSGATTVGPTAVPYPMGAPTLNFNIGESVVTYSISDLEGNTAECSFNVSVTDDIAPVALCQATTIFINPSGIADYTLLPAEIDAGSTDNCGIVNSTVFPNTFSCDDIGKDTLVTLTVSDATGNQNSCTALVAIQGEAATPNYSISLCGNDTLFLFANPPAAIGGVIYTYQWTGPASFTSTDENPIILNASMANAGSYSVEVQGITGCKSIATLEVALNPDFAQPTISQPETICAGDDLTLFVNIADGSLYTWIAPDFSTILTNSPFLLIENINSSSAGNWSVTVFRNGCTSPQANPVTVSVESLPNILADNNGPVCLGTEVMLSANNIPGAGYQWSGPNDFTAVLQNTTAPGIAGVYTVTATSPNGCSAMANTTVATLELPSIDALTFVGDDCVDGNTDLQIVSTVSGGSSPYIYNWMGPVPTGSGATLTFTDATAAVNGEYQLVVEDSNGCLSTPATTTIAVSDFPSSISAFNDGPICVGLEVQLTVENIPGASYSWSGPNNFSSTLQNPVTPAVAGDYTVIASSPNGCNATTSTTVNVLALPQIDDLTFVGENCVDGTTDLQIVSMVSNGASPYIYNWSGPQPTGTGATVTFVNATAVVNGEYQLIVQDNNDCISAPSTIDLAVTNSPAAPIISGATTICQGGNVLLTTTAYPGGTIYTWQTETEEFISSVPSLLLENVMDTTNIQVFVTVDGCVSPVGPIVQIPVNDMLPQPEITGPSEVCSGETIQLETENIAGAIYSWTGPAGFSATTFNPAVFQSGLQNEGLYQVQIEQNGCTSPLSETFFVGVNENPPTPTITSNGDVCLDADGAMISLSVSAATVIAGATYTWYNAQTNNQIGDVVSTLNFSFDPDASFTEGIAEFYVIAENEGCGSVQSAPAAVNLFEIPAGEAFAGDDFLLCDANSVSLAADNPTVGSGMWMQSGGPNDAILADPLDPNAVLTNLQSGQTYSYDWILSNGACVDYDQATVNITFESIPQANDDNVIVPFAGEANFNVKENDQIDIQFFIEVLEGPFEGIIQEIEEGEFMYQAAGNFAGDDYMIYQVCNQKCPEVCTEARVDFAVGENALCDVPTIFTPNNDGVNDSFIIPCLASDDYPENRVLIVNQYGDEVFGASPYLNNWQGTYNGEELPVGTYYFVIEFGNGQAPESGFIILER